jgi:hypothetical protein
LPKQSEELPAEFIERLKRVTAKRPRIVIDHILEHGFVTTDELKTKYGYNHPPRAAMDVKDQGIPLECFKVVNEQGRTIAAYRFGDASGIRKGFAGRQAFSKALKEQVIEANGGRCNVCLSEHELQIDHRVPYVVAGDVGFADKDVSDYMLLCRMCNRAKSWCCEHCPNWLELKKPAICLECYWASPSKYSHVAMRNERRLDLVWSEGEVGSYDRIKRRADSSGQEMPEFVKSVLARLNL